MKRNSGLQLDGDLREKLFTLISIKYAISGGTEVKREDFLYEHVVHMELRPGMTVNQLVQEFGKSGSFGAGRLSTACDIFEGMIRDEQCTIFLAVAGAVVPAGLRTVIADLIRKRLIDALVSTGANIVHDLIEALGGHHYKGHWVVDDFLLYKYHIFRIYDIFVPEEDFVKADKAMIDMFDEIARERGGHTFSTPELMREVGSRLSDSTSILRAAYEANVPVFLPAIRDSEFAFIYRTHLERNPTSGSIKVDSFKEIPEMIEIADRSPHLGMMVIGGGVPRNAVQHVALMAGKGMDYAVVITMDRPETGGLSGSTIEETVSWGKVKKRADKVMVIGDALIIFPMMVSAVLERLGEEFKRRASSP
ncbi:MAG: putative deoxyhypusine synthase [Candidatus Bathyarchaeota archaeon BA1]|nr:MAG: putative deoxyhypusine synthase [Candidatus Bathyarchaeota archaeon BA1]